MSDNFSIDFEEFDKILEKLIKDLEDSIKNKKLLKPCPKCGVKPESLTDIVKIFGFRQMKKNIATSIIRQSYCRKCR